MHHTSHQGNYFCQQCGKFFEATVELNTHCPHCNSAQLSVIVWEQTINKRVNQLDFKQEKFQDDYKITPVGEDIISHKLDIYGQKKSRRRLLLISISLIWGVGMTFLGVKALQSSETNDVQNKVLNKSSLQDSSVSNQNYEAIKQNTGEWIINYNTFRNNPNLFIRVKQLHQWDKKQLEDFEQRNPVYNKITYPKASNIQTRSVTHSSFAELAILDENNKEFNIIMVKNNDKWMIDFDHFINKNTIGFAYFLETKPIETHTFRLYFTEAKIGTQQVLTLHEAMPNNQQSKKEKLQKVSLYIDKQNTHFDSVRKLIKTWKQYKRFNKTLPDINSSVLGQEDPNNYYRVNISLKYELINGKKVLKIHSINAAHWLGDHYKKFQTPAQILTFDI